MAKTAKAFVDELQRPFQDMKLRKTATLTKFLTTIDTITDVQKAEMQVLGVAVSRLIASRAKLRGQQNLLLEQADMQLPAVIPQRGRRWQQRDARGRYTKGGLQQSEYVHTEPFIREAKRPVEVEAEVTDVEGEKEKEEPVKAVSIEFEQMLGLLTRMNKGISVMAEYLTSTKSFLGVRTREEGAKKEADKRDKKQLKGLDRIWDTLKDIRKTSKMSLLAGFFRGWLDKLLGGFGMVTSLIPKEVIIAGIAAAALKALRDAWVGGLKSELGDVVSDFRRDLVKDSQVLQTAIKEAFAGAGSSIADEFKEGLTKDREFFSLLFSGKSQEAAGQAADRLREAADEFKTSFKRDARTLTSPFEMLSFFRQLREQARLARVGGSFEAVMEKREPARDAYDVTKGGFTYVDTNDVVVDKDSLAHATGGEEGDAIKRYSFTTDAEVRTILQDIREAIKMNAAVVAGNTSAMSQSIQNISVMNSNTNLSSYKSFFDMLSKEEEF